MKFAIPVLLAMVVLPQDAAWTPFSDPLNRRHAEQDDGIDVLVYNLNLKILDDKKEIHGTATIDLNLTRDSETVQLDAEDMTISKVTDSVNEVFKHRLENGKLLIDAKRKKGEKVTVSIDYVAKPKGGFTFVEADPAYPSKPRMMWTQGETNYNHRWFPCHDYPNDRARTVMTVKVRAPFEAVSNGRLDSCTSADGWTTSTWTMDVAYVSYLVSLIVGEFDKVEETLTLGDRKIPVQYFVPKGMHTDEEIRHTFGRTVEMMKFYSEKTGAPYPYAKYAQTVVCDFTWGGMENISATTLHQYTVTPKAVWMDRNSDGLIAHELAHQWFGDLITCKTWGHIWLNEGFASYFDPLWTEQAEGREAMIEDLEDGIGWYMGEVNRYRRPTVCDHYTYPDDMFDAHTYPRGAWVLHMLRSQLGDDAWWKGIRNYVARHKEQCVTTDDFRKAMEDSSGRDLKAFFNQWLFAVGHPEFEVTQAWNTEQKSLQLTVKQTQPVEKLAFKELQTERPLFKVPVDIEIETKEGRKTHRIEVTKVEETFTFALESEPLIVDFDKDITLLKTLAFKKSVKDLACQAEKDDQPWHRSWAIRQLEKEAGAVAALRNVLLNDPSWRVRKVAADTLGTIETAESRDTLLAGLGSIDRSTPKIIEALSALTDKATPLYLKTWRDLQLETAARAAVIKSLGTWAREKAVADLLGNILETDPAPSCREAACLSIGKIGEAGFARLNEAMAKHEKNDDTVQGLLSGMLEADRKASVDVFIKFTGYGRHPWVRNRAGECLGDYLKKQIARDFPEYAKGLKRLIELVDDPNFRLRRKAVEKLTDIGDEAAIPAFEARIPKEDDKRVVKQLQQAVRKIKAPK